MSTTPTTLANAQQALLKALFTRPAGLDGDAADTCLDPFLDRHHPQSRRGLSAYRANGHALAERSLQSAYPVVAAVLGDDSFAMLARTLWHRHPPVRGDLACWGAVLPGFVRDDPQLAGLPWLADVAHVEWSLHRCAMAADRWPDAGSFQLLQTQDPDTIHLLLAPGLDMFPSPWPIASIITAHREGVPSLDEAWRRCRDNVGETALVWRHGFRPRVASIDAPTATLLHRLQAGAGLARALDGAITAGACAGTPFDFGAWLHAAVQDGLVLGATTTPYTPPPLEHVA